MQWLHKGVGPLDGIKACGTNVQHVVEGQQECKLSTAHCSGVGTLPKGLLASLVAGIDGLHWQELQSKLGPAVEGKQSTGNPKDREDLPDQDNSRICQKHGLTAPPGREAHPEKIDGTKHQRQHWMVQDGSGR